MNTDINTPEGLLDYLLHVNEHGVWFIKVMDDKYSALPRWMWSHCRRALPDKIAMKEEKTTP